MADVTVDSNLSGSVDSHFSGSMDVGPITVAGIPNTYNYYVKEFPKLVIGVDPVKSTVAFEPPRLSPPLKTPPECAPCSSPRIDGRRLAGCAKPSA